MWLFTHEFAVCYKRRKDRELDTPAGRMFTYVVIHGGRQSTFVNMC